MNRLSPKLPTPRKVKVRRLLKAISRSFWTILVLILLWQLFQLNLFLEKTKTTNLDQASAQVEQLQKELDEIREYLLIPTSEQETEQKSDQSIDQFLSMELTNFSREAQKAKRNQQYLEVLETTYQQVSQKIGEYSIVPLESAPIDQQLYQVFDQNQLQLIEFGFDGSKLVINTEIKSAKYLVENLRQFNLHLNSLFEQGTMQYLADLTFKALLVKADFLEIAAANESDTEFQSILDSKNLSLLYDFDANPYLIKILKSDASAAFQLQYDPERAQFILVDANNKLIGRTAQFQSIIESMSTYVRLNQFKTVLQQNVEDKINQFSYQLKNSQVQSRLNSLNLSVQNEDSTTQYVFKFVDASDPSLVYFEIIIDKQTAEVFKLNTATNSRTQISFLSPTQSSIKGEQTYLLAGKHGNLTDTLMLANVNEFSKKVTLLSLPRDLYLSGKKINSIYASDGIEALKTNIENITGKSIDAYFVLDMYAFIDVVDYIGGVNIYLDDEVVDPTYKTFDNGVWGTMYFAAGEHTLNGTQALRLARSRYTSSDFARAERQQIILSALKDKLTTLTFKDTKTISQIASTMIGKTETDVSLNKAITSFFKYKNYQIKTKNVLSTSNILVSAYSNEYNNLKCQNCGKGAYILVPQNNDWSLLKTYLNQVLNA